MQSEELDRYKIAKNYIKNDTSFYYSYYPGELSNKSKIRIRIIPIITKFTSPCFDIELINDKYRLNAQSYSDIEDSILSDFSQEMKKWMDNFEVYKIEGLSTLSDSNAIFTLKFLPYKRNVLFAFLRPIFSEIKGTVRNEYIFIFDENNNIILVKSCYVE